MFPLLIWCRPNWTPYHLKAAYIPPYLLLSHFEIPVLPACQTLPPPLPSGSAHLVLSSDDVRGELVAVLAAVAADVAFERLAEAMAAHVDGEHDVVQEEDATVFAAERAHRAPLAVHHLHGQAGRGRRTRAPLSRYAPSVSLPFHLCFFGVTRTVALASSVVGSTRADTLLLCRTLIIS